MASGCVGRLGNGEGRAEMEMGKLDPGRCSTILLCVPSSPGLPNMDLHGSVTHLCQAGIDLRRDIGVASSLPSIREQTLPYPEETPGASMAPR